MRKYKTKCLSGGLAHLNSCTPLPPPPSRQGPQFAWRLPPPGTATPTKCTAAGRFRIRLAPPICAFLGTLGAGSDFLFAVQLCWPCWRLARAVPCLFSPVAVAFIHGRLQLHCSSSRHGAVPLRSEMNIANSCCLCISVHGAHVHALGTFASLPRRSKAALRAHGTGSLSPTCLSPRWPA